MCTGKSKARRSPWLRWGVAVSVAVLAVVMAEPAKADPLTDSRLIFVLPQHSDTMNSDGMWEFDPYIAVPTSGGVADLNASGTPTVEIKNCGEDDSAYGPWESVYGPAGTDWTVWVGDPAELVIGTEQAVTLRPGESYCEDARVTFPDSTVYVTEATVTAPPAPPPATYLVDTDQFNVLAAIGTVLVFLTAASLVGSWRR